MICRRKKPARYGVECVQCWSDANPGVCSEIVARRRAELQRIGER